MTIGSQWSKHVISDRLVPSLSPSGDALNQDGRGKTVVMTGGNRGIGWEAMKTMLPLGYHFILGEKLSKIVVGVFPEVMTIWS